MKYSHLYRSQPRSTKGANDKKIQPLFRKQFNLEDTNSSQIHDKTFSESIEPNKASYVSLSENSTNRPGSTEAQFKIRSIHGVKSEASNNITSPTDSTIPAEELQLLLQKLKCERLEILKDLWTYESRYIDKLSMRARIKEIRNNAVDLQARLKATQDNIVKQREILQFLEASLKTVTHISHAKPSETKLQFEVPENSFKSVVHISGLVCLVSVTPDPNLSYFTIHLYPPVSCHALVTQSSALYLDTSNKGARYMMRMIRRHVLTNISLSYSNSKLSISASGIRDFRVFYTRIKGWSAPLAPVLITQLEGEYEIAIQDPKAPLKIVIYEPRLNEFFPIENLPSCRLSKLSSFVHKNLRVLRSNNKHILEWGSHNLESIFTKTKARPKFDTDDKKPGIFEQREDLVITGEIMLDDLCAYIEIRRNLLIDKMRINVNLEGLQLNFKQEENEELFRIYLSLQNLRYTRQVRTLLSSLEMQCLVKKLLKL